jgi:hypothetical protein
MFAVAPEPRGLPSAPAPWADDIVAPSPTLPKYAGYPLCKGRVGTGRRTKVVKMIETGQDLSGAEDCTGIACIRGTRASMQRPTRTRAYFLSDGLCGATCATMTRPPHALFVDVSPTVPAAIRAVRSVMVPPACTPRFVTFASGLVVLACDSALYTATAGAEWNLESLLALGPETRAADLEMLADGAAMFATYPKGPARAWVRRPVAVGDRTAWRDVTRTGAERYVLREGGAVDIIVAEPDRGDDVFSLIEDSPGEAPRTVLAHAVVGGDLWCLGRKDGAVVGLRRLERGTFERIAFTDDGVVGAGLMLGGYAASDPTGACGH